MIEKLREIMDLFCEATRMQINTMKSSMLFWGLSKIENIYITQIFPYQIGYLCWLWSLIMFLIQRSLLSAVFIPHEDFTPQKYVHSSTRGSAEGGYPLCGVRGQSPWRGFGGEAPEGKIAL
jgi:hypothetical protein